MSSHWLRSVPCCSLLVLILGGLKVHSDATTSTLLGWPVLPQSKYAPLGSSETVSVEMFDFRTGVWTSIANMGHARVNSTMVRLEDGRLMAIGGYGNYSVTDSVEILDPVSLKWTRAQPMNFPRTGHAATLLQDGRVLVYGGYASSHARPLLGNIEIYNPQSDTWSRPIETPEKRTEAQAILLSNGKVLLTSGWNSDKPNHTLAMIFDPKSETSVLAEPSPILGQGSEMALALTDGQVWAGGSSLRTALFNPQTGRWKNSISLNEPHGEGSAVQLPSGRLLVVGGLKLNLGHFSYVSEFFDQATESWIKTEPPHLPHVRHAEVLMRDRLILTGGQDEKLEPQCGSEYFDDKTSQWNTIPRMLVARKHHLAGALDDHRLIVAGGFSKPCR